MAEGAPGPPQSPPVQVAAPTSILLGAGRSPHRLASSVCTLVGTSVGANEEGPARLLGSPAPSAQSRFPGRSRPNFKVGDKKNKTKQNKTKNPNSRKEEKPQHPSPLHRNAPAAPNRVLSAGPRVNCPPSPSLDSLRGERLSLGSSPIDPGKGSRSPRTQLSPLWLLSRAFPPPCRRAQERQPGRAPLSSFRTQPPDPPPREGAGQAPGSVRGRRRRGPAGR